MNKQQQMNDISIQKIGLLDLKQQIQLLKNSDLIPLSHEGVNCQCDEEMLHPQDILTFAINLIDEVTRYQKGNMEIVRTECKEVKGGYLFAVRDCDGNEMQDEEGRTRWVTRQKALDAINSRLLTIKPWHKLI